MYPACFDSNLHLATPTISHAAPSSNYECCNRHGSLSRSPRKVFGLDPPGCCSGFYPGLGRSHSQRRLVACFTQIDLGVETSSCAGACAFIRAGPKVWEQQPQRHYRLWQGLSF